MGVDSGMLPTTSSIPNVLSIELHAVMAVRTDYSLISRVTTLQDGGYTILSSHANDGIIPPQAEVCFYDRAVSKLIRLHSYRGIDPISQRVEWLHSRHISHSATIQSRCLWRQMTVIHTNMTTIEVKLRVLIAWLNLS